MTTRFHVAAIDRPPAPMAMNNGHPGLWGRVVRTLFKLLRLRRAAAPLQLGDRFRKVRDQFDKVWEVVRIWTPVDGLLHVRLRCQDGLGETRIISAITLTDPDFFLPVSPPPKAD